MKKNHILFDLDGTLTDSQEGILNSIEHALHYYDIQVEDRSFLRPFLGPPLVDSMMKYYGFTREKALESVVKYREYFNEKGWLENRVYDGVEAMLGALKEQGYKLYVATSKPEDFAQRILQHFGLAGYFDFIGGATLDDSRVHKADVVRYVLETNGLHEKSGVIMIGDRENDVRGAKENELESIGVLYGYGDLAELRAAGADYVAETPAAIVRLLRP
ncbi:MAG: HAD family hydrolase [Lachnospiraceae bacterium]|nr:HAD family hydrolase [Lachnospiraceae bacterium]